MSSDARTSTTVTGTEKRVIDTKAANAKYPIPHALDDVMEVALAKNPNIRTRSVGELATAIGRAYGLEGDHRTWARMPQAELAKLVAEGLARMPPPKPAAIEAAADPFAAPIAAPSAPGAPMTPAPPIYANPPPPQPQPYHAYAQNDPPVGGIPGLDSGRPQWLIPVVVGIAALVLGGGIAIVLAR